MALAEGSPRTLHASVKTPAAAVPCLSPLSSTFVPFVEDLALSVTFPVLFLLMFVKLCESRCPDRFTMDDPTLTADHIAWKWFQCA